MDFEAGETLLRFYSEKRGEWLNVPAPMPAIPRQRPMLKLTDELLAARLKKQPKQDFRLELDSFFIQAPIQERRDELPYLPRLTILADRDNGQMLAQHLALPEEDPAGNVLAMLLGFMEERGRPAAVYVRDDRLGTLLKAVCAEIDVHLVAGQGMPVVDEIFEEMLDMME